jgi:hypothetical protein
MSVTVTCVICDVVERRAYVEIPIHVEDGCGIPWDHERHLHGEVRASEGVALQIRPKGKNADDTTRRADDEGAPTRQLKRAFYLRATFTESILARSGLTR